MSAVEKRAAEVDVNVSLVRRLLAAQFPKWEGLPLEPVDSTGTDNAIFRLGEDMCVRLPRAGWAIKQVDKEQRWLPMLAPLLPLPIPVPLAMGVPAEGYPWRWSVYSWLVGETATCERITDQRQFAIALAQFVAALRRIDTAGGPPAGSHNFFRGVPLERRDTDFRDAVATLHNTLDADAVIAAWEAALRAPAWADPPVWIHGDLAAGNLLVEQGRLSAVIDFGGLGVGDPACDLFVAWNIFSSEARKVFREALTADDATWARGRGWALFIALNAIPDHQDINPVIVASARHMIDEVLADHARGA